MLPNKLQLFCTIGIWKEDFFKTVLYFPMLKFDHHHPPTPLWPHPVPGDHDLKQLQFKLPEDATTHI